MAYQWTLEKMITRERAEKTAMRLFPSDIHVADCKNFPGLEGLPCPICAEHKNTWEAIVQRTREAMLAAFA